MEIFDSSMYFLGKLCKRGHQWETTGQSLRYTRNHGCVECEREQKEQRRKDEDYKAIQEKGQAKYRATEKYQQTYANLRATPERKAQMAIAQAKYSETEYGKATRKQAEQKHGKTDKRRVSMSRSSTKRNRLKQGNSEYYSASDMASRWGLFDNACAYCGKSDSTLTQDHFFPLKTGGADAIWNLVPACLSCNLSKNASDPEKWYRSRAFFDEVRWTLLCSLMYDEDMQGQFKISVTQMRMELEGQSTS